MKTTSFLYSTLAADPDLSDIVDLFVEEMPDRIAAFTNLLSEKNYQELARTAHQLKGAAGSYGFMEISPLAAKVEVSARERYSEEEIQRSVRELCELCRLVRRGVPEQEED